MSSLLNYIGRVLCLCLPLALVGCGDEKMVCGPVIEKKEWGQQSYRYHSIVFTNSETGLPVFVDVSASTYYSKNVGDRVCFTLNKWQLER